MVGYPIRTASGEAVTGAHEYYRLDAAGVMQRLYGNHSSASEDDVSGSTHRVVGDALVSYHSIIKAVPWAVDENGECPHTEREAVEVDGLVTIPPEMVFGPDPAGAVRAALDDYRRRERERWEASQRPVNVARASFAAALDAHDFAGQVELVFGYDDGPVVRDPAGAVIWRPTERPAMRGKDLYWFLHRALRERFGDRLGAFRIDIAGAPWWFWAPDE